MHKQLYIKDTAANLNTIRDPMVVVVGDTYYLTGTQPPYWEGINEGVHLWSSKDLVHFTDHGLILKREDMPEEMWYRDRFWAPELFDGKDGWFYLTFNCRNESEKYNHGFGIGLARAREITGPYEIMTKEGPLSDEEGQIDGTLFRDDDGAVYLGGNSVHKRLMLYRLDLETAVVSEEQVVCNAGEDGEWDSIGVEGQCIVKRHGIYFQWYSSWTKDYAAGILTSNSIHGPWKKYEGNPVLCEGEEWKRAGHNHSFRGTDGNDYITFHANLKNPDGEDVERFFVRQVEYKPEGTVEIHK